MNDRPMLSPSTATAATCQLALLEAILGAPTEIGILATDTDFVIQRCNPIAASLFGMPAEALIGRTVPQVHDEIGVDNGRFRHAVALAVERGEYRFPQRVQVNGVTHHLDSRLLPLRDAGGALCGFTLLARDQTRLREAEDMQRKLSRAVEQSPVSIIITDPRGNIEYVNARFTQITGYGSDEVVGRRMGLLKSGQTPDSTYGMLWQTVLAGREWSGELLNRRKNGELYWDSVHIMPVLDADGTVTHFVSMQEDITARKQAALQLGESESRFRAIFENSRDAILLLRGEQCAFVNPACARMFGFAAPEDVVDRSALDLFAPRSRAMVRENIRRRGAGEAAPIAYEAHGLRHAGNDGQDKGHGEGQDEEFDIELRVSTYAHAGEQYILTLIRDISERKRDEEKLRLWATVFENSGEAVMITDADNRIVLVNEAFTRITGYAADEVVGHNPSLLGSGRHDHAFFQQMWQSLRSRHHWQGEIWDRRKNGEVYPKWLGISAVSDAGGALSHYVAIFSDISERKAAQDRIEYLAHHDPLTGLPNRLLLRDRFVQAAAQAERTQQRVALLFLDLDRFKTVNDSLGHPVGDRLLQALAGRLGGCVREADTISRQGGDEFIVIAGDLPTPEAAAGIAQKILEHLHPQFEIDGHVLSASFSIGISLFPDDGHDFDTLLQKADTAMYHAKDAGRNAYRFYTEQMNVDALERLLIQNRIRKAVEQREFVLHYQPQVELASGRITGVEALLRWNNPELGLVAPARFIPIAEESGQIVALGEWVLHEACRQGQAWREAGLPPLTMAVNISALQLQRGNLVRTVLAALAESGFDAGSLELELTESILIHEVDKTLDTVRELQALGIKISIDDFGTGYSSLSYLKRFAVDRIKIDRSFVRDITTDPEDAAIVRAVIQMARSLHLVTLAEGAETQAQIDYLREEGCEAVQGFFYSRPLEAARLAELVAATPAAVDAAPR